MNINKEDLQEELKVGKKKSAKPMLWVSMISMVMFFAGLTSAYVISMRRDDWVTFDLPDAFYISTILIIFRASPLLYLKNCSKRIKENYLSYFY